MARINGSVLISLFLMVVSLVGYVTSAKILFLMPLATKSETHLLNAMAKGLLGRGHDVTLVTPVSSSIKHNNFTEIIPVKPLDLGDFDTEGHKSVLDMRKSKDNLMQLLFVDFSYIYDRCHAIYQHKDFAPVVEADSYDLVLTSSFFSECFVGLINKLKAPYIMYSSMPMTKEVLDLSGLRTPLSFVPHPFIAFTDSMSFSERLINTLSQWSYTLLNHYHFHKIGEKVYKQYLGDDVAGVEEMRKNVSMIFSNTHFSLNFPRPTMPDVVEIGGVHVGAEPAKPLRKDIEAFCSGGKNGFIFFSLGTVFREETLPDNLKQMFINVFSRLKTRVLWKWGSEIKGLPEHIKVSKWLPQADLLGHPKLRLFISHGGLLSTQEATYHGVPILGIPLFVDQDVNIKAAEAHGYAMKLELLEMSEELLESSINRMLNDSSFIESAKHASAVFRDQPQTPMERAIYWMEYIIKYKGAPQLRSVARNLSFIEYNLLDVQLLLLAIVGTVILIVWKIISICLLLGSGGYQHERKAKKRLVKKYQ